MPSPPTPIRGVRRLHSRLARFEANIAKSSDSDSAVFLSNVASGRAQRAVSSNTERASTATRGRRSITGAIDSTKADHATVLVGDREIMMNDLLDSSTHTTQSGRINIRVRKPSGDKNSLGPSSTTHMSLTNSSELLPVQKSAERAQSAPRVRRAVATEEGNVCSQLGVQARREVFERRTPAAGNTTESTSLAGNATISKSPKSIFKRRASTSPLIPENTSVASTTPSKSIGKLGNFTSKRGSCGPGVSILKASTTSRPFQYEYDYYELKNKWSTLASTKTGPIELEDPDIHKRLGFLKRLSQYKRRQVVAEPEIVKSVQRRGSTGKMAALKPLEKESTKTNKVNGKYKSKNVSGSKQKIVPRNKKRHLNETSRLVKRRNSMGNTRLSDEPVVALYWNPARERLMDPVGYLVDETQEMDNAAIPSPPTMYDRGIVQRRASTGRLRLDEEDTTWLYAREDHEIADADVRGGERHKKNSKKKKSVAKMNAAKEKLRAQSSMNSSSKKSSFLRKMSMVPTAQSSLSKQEDHTNETSSDDDSVKKPRRRIERRGSTGAVPLSEEADSRLHRKKKMRQDHKRRRRATNLSREGKSMKPDASPEARPKASLLGLLDPYVALDDGTDDPSSWLAGDEEHVFTIAPYKPPPPKIRKTQKLTPRELELDLDGDSSDDDSDNFIDDDFERQFFSLRPGMTRGKSFTAAGKNDPGDDKTQTTENDSDDEGEDFAATVFGLRPGTTRGNSFALKRDPPKATVDDKAQKPDSDSNSDDDCSPANFFGGRPGATRGGSFLMKRDPTKPVDNKYQAPESDCNSDDDCSPVNFFGGRPGATRGMSFVKKRPVPEPIIENQMSTVDEFPRNSSSKPVTTTQKIVSVPTEPTSPVAEVKNKKSHLSDEKSSSSSHKAPSTPKSSSKKKKVSSDKKSEEKKKSSASTEEKAVRTPKTPLKTKKGSLSGRSTTKSSPTKITVHGKQNKTPKKSPEKRDWTFKMVSPSRTLHGYGDDDHAKELKTKQIPMSPVVTGSDKSPTRKRRASTSAVTTLTTPKADKGDSISSTRGISFGKDQVASPSRASSGKSKTDKKLLKALTLISKADQSQVIEALHQLGETNPGVEVLQSELLGKKQETSSKTKHAKEKKEKKATTKAKARG